MDPYKLLGVDRHKVADKHSLELVRQKTKRLWKEHAEKKEKFECQKVMEAFAMIQKDVFHPQHELQRSARERDLDRMYNRQTKEIDKRKKRSRQFQSSSERMRIRMKRVNKERRRESERRRRKRLRIVRPKPPTVASEGLRRLRDILLVPDKFAKAVKLLHRWVSEYCEPSIREYLFEVLAEVCDAGTVAQDSLAAKDAIAVFSKVFLDSQEWFAQSDLHQRVRRWWSIAGIWNNEICTDDHVVFTKVISKFEELLEEFVTRPEQDDCSLNFTYALLSTTEVFDRMRDHFVIGLRSLHEKWQKLPWCKVQVEQLFQDVYYKRDRFTVDQQEVISRMQADIKKKHKGAVVATANICPLRPHVPVIDGRDTVSIGSGDQVWIAKQWTR